MITCPECGFAADDGAKFCDRCGQGLAPSAGPARVSLPPLKPGAVLKGGFQIVALLSASSAENRYRVTRAAAGKQEPFQLRERRGPAPEPSDTPDAQLAPHQDAPASAPQAVEDPNGPRAKTKELKPLAAAEATAAAELASAAADSAVQISEPPVDSPQPEEPSAPIVPTEAAADGSVEPPAVLEAMAGSATAHETVAAPPEPPDDLGEVFGRVMGLSLTLKHPAFQRALSGFAQDGRVYLVFTEERLTPLSHRAGGIRMNETEAIGLVIQVCQAVTALHRRALRANDICPDSVVLTADGRVKLTGLDYVSNDNELQSEPIFNDGYTAPEIYKGKKVDKRADVFSIGALLYTCLTGERIAAESWLEEAGAITFYPPHVVSPPLEPIVRLALAFNAEDRWPTADALKAELIKLTGAIRIRAAALTDVGRVRELNEDSVMAIEYARQSQVEPAQNYLYIVADGMGGAAAGEVASAIAVGTLRDYVESRLATAEAKDPCELVKEGELLKEGFEEANRRILEHQAANPELRGMGSTAVGALILPPEAAVAWVGDSRAYLSDGAGLRQLTRDHSLVQRLIEIGQLTPEEARHHEHKNVITRSLGARQSGPAGAEAMALKLKRGDRLLLCSDGLTTHVEDQQIGEILGRHHDPYEASRELIAAANAGGGTDNISVVVIFAE
jgi:serine/threonine protein phosphatase PrpC